MLPVNKKIRNSAKPKPKPKPKPKGTQPRGGAPKVNGHFGANPAGTAYGGVNKQSAMNLAQSTVNGEIRDLNEQQQRVNATSNNAKRSAEGLYNRGVGDLNYVNGEVTDFLKKNQASDQQNYQRERSNQEAATKALQASLGNTYSGASQGASDELARLGIQGGGNLSGIQADAANAQTLAQVSGGNALSSMDLAASNAGQLGSMLQGMAAGSHVANIGKNLNAYNDSISKINQNKMDQTNEVERALRDTSGKRSDNYLQLLQQLQQTGYGQFITAKQNKVGRFAPPKKHKKK